MWINNYRVVSTGWKHKDRVHLRWVTDVHWSGLERSWFERRRLHALLSALPTVPYIRLLSLFDADINEAQQAFIFGIPTLRKLEICFCRIHPSTKPLPLSSINALKISRIDVQTIRRLLTLLATTVESLEVT